MHGDELGEKRQSVPNTELNRFIDIRIHTPAPDVTVIRVSGELDMLTAPLMGERVREQVVRSRQVVVDLSRVDFLGSNCLTEMLKLHRQATAQGNQVHWVGVTRSAVARPIEITGLDKVLSVYSISADEIVARLCLERLLQDGSGRGAGHGPRGAVTGSSEAPVT